MIDNAVLIGIITVGKVETRIDQQLLPFEIDNVEKYQFSLDGNRIVMVSATPSCLFCGRLGVKSLGNYFVCTGCIKQLRRGG